MAEAPALPTLHVAELDDATLDALFTDLGALARVESVRLKLTEDAYAERGVSSLEQAREALRTGRCVGAQLCYTHGGQTWLDTLIRGPKTTRLTRRAV